MQFTLTFSLDNDEAASMDKDTILPIYLRQVADQCARGREAGAVVDGNGNTIGKYQTTDD